MPAVGEVCVAAYEDDWYIGKVSQVRSAECREAQVELMKEISQKQFVWDETVTHTHTTRTTVHANFILRSGLELMPSAILRHSNLMAFDYDTVSSLFQKYKRDHFE